MFVYLENWVPPVPADLPIAPIRTEALRQDLSRKASVLIGAIGASNELSILSGAARHYQAQIAKALPLIRANLRCSAANPL